MKRKIHKPHFSTHSKDFRQLPENKPELDGLAKLVPFANWNIFERNGLQAYTR